MAPPSTWYRPLITPAFSTAAWSLGSSTTQMTVVSRLGSRQIRHSSPSETLKHSRQNRTLLLGPHDGLGQAPGVLGRGLDHVEGQPLGRLRTDRREGGPARRSGPGWGPRTPTAPRLVLDLGAELGLQPGDRVLPRGRRLLVHDAAARPPRLPGHAPDPGRHPEDLGERRLELLLLRLDLLTANFRPGGKASSSVSRRTRPAVTDSRLARRIIWRASSRRSSNWDQDRRMARSRGSRGRGRAGSGELRRGPPLRCGAAVSAGLALPRRVRPTPGSASASASEASASVAALPGVAAWLADGRSPSPGGGRCRRHEAAAAGGRSIRRAAPSRSRRAGGRRGWGRPLGWSPGPGPAPA